MQDHILLDDIQLQQEEPDYYHSYKRMKNVVLWVSLVAFLLLGTSVAAGYYLMTSSKVSPKAEPVLGNPLAHGSAKWGGDCGKCDLVPGVSDYVMCTSCAKKLDEPVRIECPGSYTEMRPTEIFIGWKKSTEAFRYIREYCSDMWDDVDQVCEFTYNDLVAYHTPPIDDMEGEPVDFEGEEGEIIDGETIDGTVGPLTQRRPGMFGPNGMFGPKWSNFKQRFPPFIDWKVEKKIITKYMCSVDSATSEEYMLTRRQSGCAKLRDANDQEIPDFEVCTSSKVSQDTKVQIECPTDLPLAFIFKTKVRHKSNKLVQAAAQKFCSVDDNWNPKAGDSNKNVCVFDLQALAANSANGFQKPTRRPRKQKQIEILLSRLPAGMMVINWACVSRK